MGKFKRLPLCFAISALTFLTACGGASEEATDLQPTEAPPEPRVFLSYEFSQDDSLVADGATGLFSYQPTNVNGDPEVIGSGIAMVSPTGRMMIATDSLVAFSRIEHNGRSFTGDLVNVDFTKTDGTSLMTIYGQRDTVSGANPATNIVGTFEDESGQLAKTYWLVNQEDPTVISDLTDLAATYRFSEANGIVTAITIDGGGMLTGSDTTGCTFTGEIFAPVSGSNLLEAWYEATGCGSTATVLGQQRDGEYNALGYYNAELYTLALFGSNQSVVSRYVGIDVNAPEPEPEPEPDPDADAEAFVYDDFTVEPSVAARLPAGFYTYTDLPLGDIDGNDEPESGEAFISSTGRVYVATAMRRFFSRGQVSETNTYVDTVTQAQVDQSVQVDPVETVRLVPSFDAGEPVVLGSLEDAEGRLRVRFKMAQDELSSMPENGTLTFSDIAGTYLQTSLGNLNTEITIALDGQLTGSDTTGCSFFGTVYIPDPAVNVIEARFDAGNCGANTEASGEERNQTYNAVGSVSGGTLRLFMAAENNLTARFEGS